ncbi:hypothetical protein [Thalassobaculum sp.]|uniref:hypothetical protein n=1 Tax=Thalassobaculum sp. TaxID=2022740 RepID=UPI0032EC8BB5
MRKSTKILAAASLLVAGLAAAPALHAHESGGSGGSMMGQGMMGEMTEMMAGCSEMMQSMRQGGSGAPNEQWRQDTPGQAPSNG